MFGMKSQSGAKRPKVGGKKASMPTGKFPAFKEYSGNIVQRGKSAGAKKGRKK